ncbi:nucleotidyl transferase AbiEii/AbiGii toxin family protein [Aquiflexum sp. LQ15W]|uniref:nucleotidyl transferase AbiEii/AbiGii toxin family protein n=1 Tax=Cognataquiflexum nitidum TaxID=2922272 RepID=UPI001F12E5CC|nr:nucleotidyl transferase AbiEii/AbiGii toxin family protein [Cognataquiflexum nitidum]MCH6198582.1 nucleotidyl transferase AbiEii/AbiGii toxin family protein [Cognataquiflexum nitidum]
MLGIDEIQKFFPEHLHKFRRFMLREYLQYKILQIVFESSYGNKLIFLGGSCLRIVHGNQRFSEDLDFDNLGLTENEFESISLEIKNSLSNEGYEVEIQNRFRGAFHCLVKFPKLLFDSGLSGYEEEKILIQLDTEAQHFEFISESYILNRFDVFCPIKVVPLKLLLAKKFYAILNRPRNKGRDFFDVVFILSKIQTPDYGYLRQKIGISAGLELKNRIIEHCEKISMEEMASDVASFLFSEKDKAKVLLFKEFISQQSL